MVAHLNGDEWPDLPTAPPDLPKMGDHPSLLELAQNYATLAVYHVGLWDKVIHALEYLRGHVIGAKNEAAAASREIRRLREEMEIRDVRATETKIPSPPGIPGMKLPPMRPELPSTAQVIENVSKRVSGSFEKIAKESQGPYVEAPPERLADEVKKALSAELAARDALRNAARIQEIEDAEKHQKKLRKKIIVGGVLAFVVAFGTAAGTWSWGKAQGSFEGHVKGLEEGKKAVTQGAK
jgi:hypothetical protein